jgi:uncharacterized protein
MLPPVIPLFPLPNVVLFPGVFLPLHIFEPRYRAMTEDALDGDRIIGMALLQPGWEREYEGRPPVYATGCAGVISHAEKLPDGRFNIVLNGLEKFRVMAERQERAYRLAEVLGLPEVATDEHRRELRQRRGRLEALVLEALHASEVRIPTSLSDEDLVHALCQYLEFSPPERQALLERDGVLARAHALTELLEMQSLLARRPSASSHRVH